MCRYVQLCNIQYKYKARKYCCTRAICVRRGNRKIEMQESHSDSDERNAGNCEQNGNSIKLHFTWAYLHMHNVYHIHAIECEASTSSVACRLAHSILPLHIYFNHNFNCCLKQAHTHTHIHFLWQTCSCHVKQKYFRNGFINIFICALFCVMAYLCPYVCVSFSQSFFFFFCL